jgi:hypothetical protein
MAFPPRYLVDMVASSQVSTFNVFQRRTCDAESPFHSRTLRGPQAAFRGRTATFFVAAHPESADQRWE